MSVRVKFFSLLHVFWQKSQRFLQSLCTNTADDLALTSKAEEHCSAMWETYLLLSKS